MEPKISIIVPVYKVEKHLNRCVNSIINQTYKNLEIILINDGSPDNCSTICDHYAETDSRVIVIHQENKGLSGARNSGIKMASGDYIGFVDSDDWIEFDMYKTMLNAFEKYDVDIVECGIAVRYEPNYTIDRSGSIIFEDRLQALKRIIKNQNFSVCRRLYRKNTLKGFFFVEGKNSEDVYFTIDIFKNVNNIIYISNNFYNYFMSEESITRGRFKLKMLDSIDAALYLQKKISHEKDKELLKISNNFILEVLLKNYKLLNYNFTYDTKLEHRKKIKNLIKENYIENNKTPLHLKLARYTPIYFFFLLASVFAFFKKYKKMLYKCPE